MCVWGNLGWMTDINYIYILVWINIMWKSLKKINLDTQHTTTTKNKWITNTLGIYNNYLNVEQHYKNWYMIFLYKS